MLRVKLPSGAVGTVQGYVSVQHVVMAVILVDTILVSMDINKLTEVERVEHERDTRSVGSSGYGGVVNADGRSNGSANTGIKGK